MKRFLLSSFICLSLFSAPSVMAGDDHNHEPAVEAAPHGGVLRNADPYKAEIVINGDNVKVYVYDKALKPQALKTNELKGRVQFPKEEKKPVVFAKKGDFFEATIKGISKVHRYDLHLN